MADRFITVRIQNVLGIECRLRPSKNAQKRMPYGIAGESGLSEMQYHNLATLRWTVTNTHITIVKVRHVTH